MRKSEEIKKGLGCCSTCYSCGSTCPYDGPGDDVSECTTNLSKDALAYIEQLEEQIAKRDNLLAVMGVSVPKEG